MADSCYSARLGKRAVAALRQRHVSGESNVPICSLVAASDKPERNFSVTFGLGLMGKHRKLTRATCARIATCSADPAKAEGGDLPLAVEIVEDIKVGGTEFDPWYFFYAPAAAVAEDAVVYCL